MKIFDYGEYVEIIESVKEINDRHEAAGLPQPMVVFDWIANTTSEPPENDNAD